MSRSSSYTTTKSGRQALEEQRPAPLQQQQQQQQQRGQWLLDQENLMLQQQPSRQQLQRPMQQQLGPQQQQLLMLRQQQPQSLQQHPQQQQPQQLLLQQQQQQQQALPLPNSIRLDQIPRWNEQEQYCRSSSDTFFDARADAASCSSDVSSERELGGNVGAALLCGSGSGNGEGGIGVCTSGNGEGTAARDPRVGRSGSFSEASEGPDSFRDPLTCRGSGKSRAIDAVCGEPKFPVDPEVNSKVLLWRGLPWALEVDAVVNSTNEHMDEAVATLGLHAEAGPGLAEECSTLGGCRTGEAKYTGAYNLPARHVFHTVGPRYSAKYHTAAENALSHCYRACLELLVELQLHTIAFPCIYTEAKGYPREAAAHVAIRTVRRFLDKYGHNIKAVVFCISTATDNDIYKRLLPLYFPRDRAEEEAAAVRLPADVGDETGAASSGDRRIRIASSFPGTGPSTPRSSVSFCTTSHGSESLDALVGPEFLEMSRDPDDRRREQWDRAAALQASWAWVRLIGLDGLAAPPLTLGEEFALHSRYLARAMKLDLSEIAEMKIVYRGGVDVAGRNVMVVVGAHFLPRCLDLESFVLFLVRELEPIMHRPFCIVYLHAAVKLPVIPDLGWIKRLHHILGPRHRRNLQAIYIVHPTLGLRTAIWALQVLVDPLIWKRVHYFERLIELFRYVPRDQITLPEFVLMHDIEVNPLDAMSISYRAHPSVSPQARVIIGRDF